MNLIEIYSSATVLGATVGVTTAVVVYRGLVARLGARELRRVTAIDLEKRRHQHRTGRTEDVRENAGLPARLDSILPITQLGSLARRKIDRKL